MATKSYQTYRGRPPRWKKILTVILILILIGAVAFLALEKYQVFDGEGSRIELRLPQFFDREDTSSDEEEGDTEGEKNESQQHGDDYDEDLIINIEKPAKVENALLAGRTVSAEAAQNGDFTALKEGERPVITVKATHESALIDDESVSAALSAKLADRDAILRLSCFADSDKAKVNPSMALMSIKGRPWGNPQGKSYLNPYSEEAQQYLIGIMQHCVTLGATEILLDDVQFPTEGRISSITFGGAPDSPTLRMEAITGFLEKAKKAIGDEVKLSIALPVSLLEDPVDGVSGFDLKSIAACVDRIYMPAADQAAADAARAAVGALREGMDEKTFFAAETRQPITGGSYLLIG